jgi:hypothetical protein
MISEIKINETNKSHEEMLYLKSLSERGTQSYKIAKSHLGSSFCLQKSNGFIQWQKDKYNAILNSQKIIHKF